jgi:hypothetical protein
MIPGMTPVMGQGMIPGMTPVMGQGMIPGMTPGMTPVMGQGMIPGMIPGMTPVMGQGMTPGMGQEMTPGIFHQNPHHQNPHQNSQQYPQSNQNLSNLLIKYNELIERVKILQKVKKIVLKHINQSLQLSNQSSGQTYAATGGYKKNQNKK